MYMKIVKRDGRIVEYNSDKIRIAIGKANDEVSISERLSDEEIEKIIEYIELLDKKRMLVEDIQDIIEEKIMEMGKYSLAKKYIIYRYKRSIIRQTNTTDASILSLLKNNSYGEVGCLIVNRQRDVMAGEASKDLAYRLLLPQNVVDADKDNRIKFCNVEYFTEPSIESALVKLSDMFENGTVINGVKIEEPKSFQSACNVLVEIISNLSFCQTGGIYIELKDLFKYYNMSYEKKYEMYKSLMRDSLTNEQICAVTETQVFLEVKSGIQTIFYQTNTMPLSNGLEPQVYFLINPKDITSQAEEKIVYEFIKQKTVGIKDENDNYFVTKYPMIIYSVEDDFENSPCDYITKELLNSETDYIAMGEKKFSEFRKACEKFNQGSIILNLANLALYAKANEEKGFFDILEENLGYCYEGFLCRNHNLQGIYSDKSPVHWRYGSIARLGKMEKIDNYLRKEHSTLTLVIVGFEAAVKILGDDYKTGIRDKILEMIKNWNKENSFEIVLTNYYEEKTINKMYEKDESELKKYGVTSLLDSSDFMNNDYFKNGNLYLCTNDINVLVDKDVLAKNWLIKKDSSNE